MLTCLHSSVSLLGMKYFERQSYFTLTLFASFFKEQYRERVFLYTKYCSIIFLKVKNKTKTLCDILIRMLVWPVSKRVFAEQKVLAASNKRFCHLCKHGHCARKGWVSFLEITSCTVAMFAQAAQFQVTTLVGFFSSAEAQYDAGLYSMNFIKTCTLNLAGRGKMYLANVFC